MGGLDRLVSEMPPGGGYPEHFLSSRKASENPASKNLIRAAKHKNSMDEFNQEEQTALYWLREYNEKEPERFDRKTFGEEVKGVVDLYAQKRFEKIVSYMRD